MLALFTGLAVADITISRTINSVTVGTGKLTIDGSACSSMDAYGSNNCKLEWNTPYTFHASVSQTVDITAGATFSGDFKMEKFIPFKFSCPLCGDECKVTVPVISKTISVKMPACPISGTTYQNTTTKTLPPSSKLPIGLAVTGKLTATDAAGNTILDADIDVDAKKDAADKPALEVPLGPAEREAMLAATINTFLEMMASGMGLFGPLFADDAAFQAPSARA